MMLLQPVFCQNMSEKLLKMRSEATGQENNDVIKIKVSKLLHKLKSAAEKNNWATVFKLSVSN